MSGSRDASRDVWDVSWDASRYVVPKSRYVVPEFRDVVPKSTYVVPEFRYVVPEFRDVEPHPGTHPGTLGHMPGLLDDHEEQSGVTYLVLASISVFRAVWARAA